METRTLTFTFEGATTEQVEEAMVQITNYMTTVKSDLQRKVTDAFVAANPVPQVDISLEVTN